MLQVIHFGIIDEDATLRDEALRFLVSRRKAGSSDDLRNELRFGRRRKRLLFDLRWCLPLTENAAKLRLGSFSRFSIVKIRTDALRETAFGIHRMPLLQLV